MFLSPYYSEREGTVIVSQKQASHFAKRVADDFNPIHDEDNRRFCVPGDLIFALALSRFGVYQSMSFAFTGMVGGDVPLRFPKTMAQPGTVDIAGPNKPVVEMVFSGEVRKNDTFEESVIRQYVAFSGQNFPHILVPAMADQGVMINPERPLVMYQSMALHFDCLDFETTTLNLTNVDVVVSGKRGDVTLDFSFFSDGGLVGRGHKKLAIAGLQPYDETRMTAIIAEFNNKKSQWLSANG